MFDRYTKLLTRRQLFGRASTGIGVAALASVLNPQSATARAAAQFTPRAKRVIFLLQSGAPSQVDLFDAKPMLHRRNGEELPESVRMGQRLTSMTAQQSTRPLTPSQFKFGRHGACGTELSELLPHTARVVDDLCFIRSMHTEAINHDPAITFLQTGSQQPGRPSMGSWISYGLGSENADLPAFVVLISGGSPGDQPLFGRLWSAGFLPSQHQGVKFRGAGDPILYLSNPPGITAPMRRRMLDVQSRLNALQLEAFGDPEIETRIEQAELAYRMQMSVPELTDLSREPEETFDRYGSDARKPGTYAANCLLARRLVERGVRFVQLYHRDWDHHLNLPTRLREKCRETDQASAALVADLKQRGLLDETLVVWGGEFGRTAYCQGALTVDNYGRDHHPRCFTMWLAGGGIRGGVTFGETDEFSYNVVADPVHVHDLQATLLHCLGLDHEHLTYTYQGRAFRLTDTAGQVIRRILDAG